MSLNRLVSSPQAMSSETNPLSISAPTKAHWGRQILKQATTCSRRHSGKNRNPRNVRPPETIPVPLNSGMGEATNSKTRGFVDSGLRRNNGAVSLQTRPFGQLVERSEKYPPQ